MLPTNRYIMPVFEDGSSYQPGSRVYDLVENAYSPKAWNVLTSAQKINAIEELQKSQERTVIRPSPGPPPPRRPSNLDDLLARMERSRAKRSLGVSDIKGVFGSAPGLPFQPPGRHRGP